MAANMIWKPNLTVQKRVTDAQRRALEMTAEALHTHVVQAQVIPRMDGTLQGPAMSIDRTQAAMGTVSIVHSTPYARRLYFHPEYNFHREPWEETRKNKDGSISHLTHEGNPNAKGKWFEDYFPGGKHQNYCFKAYQKFFRRLSGL